MTKKHSLLLKVASVLWCFWGCVHVFAGVMTILQDTPGAVAGIADAVDPAMLVGEYHPAFEALLNQHGFNLVWIGAFTVVGCVYIWKGSVTAIFMTAIVGWITDVGYFVFMDLGGFVHFVPGTVMTIVSTAAVVLSFWVYFDGLRGARSQITGT